LGIDSHGSCGGSDSPACISSIEMLSGELDERHVAVARRAVDRDAGLSISRWQVS
jgi:hypothetical protein